MDGHSKPALLRAKGARCRELAETATDPKVARALREVAADIDSVIPIIAASAEG
jgi:hypothetical protein